MKRRAFLSLIGAAGLGAAMFADDASAETRLFRAHPDAAGVLFDATRCIGCRKCEEACNKVKSLPAPKAPFDDLSVLNKKRRTDAFSYTVVNKYTSASPGAPVFCKIQCNHCLEPACAAACFVRAMKKDPAGSGAVLYDPNVCVGCRYCMVACPFNIPAYEYHKIIDARIMKCDFCHPRTSEGLLPGCVEACPTEALTFGKRAEILKIAHARLIDYPDIYANSIYGEQEMGGTSWLYLSPVSFEQIGLREDLGKISAPELNSKSLELLPLAAVIVPALLAGVYAVAKRKDKDAALEKKRAVEEVVANAQKEAQDKLAKELAKAESQKKKFAENEVKKALEETAKKE